MAAKQLGDDEFRDLLRTFRLDAFYFEAQETYALDYERADLERFLAGTPTPPPLVNWWRPWLEQVNTLTQRGKHVSRVRIVSEPPSDYQRWQLWALPWHTRAGERIRYLARSKAERLKLPLSYDWWLLDSSRVIRLNYDSEGRIVSKTLLTGPKIAAQHRKWRDLAVRNATPAEQIAAA
jgi:hypothetical protein